MTHFDQGSADEATTSADVPIADTAADIAIEGTAADVPVDDAVDVSGLELGAELDVCPNLAEPVTACKVAELDWMLGQGPGGTEPLGTNPAIAATPGGDFVVVWVVPGGQCYPPSEEAGIRAAVFDPQGTAKFPPFWVSQVPAEDSPVWPYNQQVEVAPLAGDKFLVVWGRKEAGVPVVKTTICGTDGMCNADEELIAAGGSPVAMAVRGEHRRLAWIRWSEASVAEVILVKLSPEGELDGEEIVVSSELPEFFPESYDVASPPGVDVFPDGHAVVAWMGEWDGGSKNSEFGVLWTTVSEGLSFVGPVQVYVGPDYNSWPSANPEAVAFDDGSAAIVYSGIFRALGIAVNPDGSLGSTDVQLSEFDPESAKAPNDVAAARLESCLALVSWNDYSGYGFSGARIVRPPLEDLPGPPFEIGEPQGLDFGNTGRAPSAASLAGGNFAVVFQYYEDSTGCYKELVRGRIYEPCAGSGGK